MVHRCDDMIYFSRPPYEMSSFWKKADHIIYLQKHPAPPIKIYGFLPPPASLKYTDKGPALSYIKTFNSFVAECSCFYIWHKFIKVHPLLGP